MYMKYFPVFHSYPYSLPIQHYITSEIGTSSRSNLLSTNHTLRSTFHYCSGLSDAMKTYRELEVQQHCS
jgi:hypothetical protein